MGEWRAGELERAGVVVLLTSSRSGHRRVFWKYNVVFHYVKTASSFFICALALNAFFLFFVPSSLSILFVWILYVCYQFRCASSLWPVAYIYMYTIIVPARFSDTHSYDSQSLRIHSVPTSRQSFYCLLASRWRHRSRSWSTVCSHPNTDQRTGLCKYNCIIMAHRFSCGTKQQNKVCLARIHICNRICTSPAYTFYMYVEISVRELQFRVR